MKTVIYMANMRSIILVEGGVLASIEEDHVRVGPERIYGLGASNVEIHDIESAPTDWVSGKYKFESGVLVLDPDWVEPPSPHDAAE